MSWVKRGSGVGGGTYLRNVCSFFGVEYMPRIGTIFFKV